jgi:hypothetical protein
MAGSSSVTGQRLTTWMKVTIALLVVYVLTLVIEVPIWLYLLIKRYGAAFAIGNRPDRLRLWPAVREHLDQFFEVTFCYLANKVSA